MRKYIINSQDNAIFTGNIEVNSYNLSEIKNYFGGNFPIIFEDTSSVGFGNVYRATVSTRNFGNIKSLRFSMACSSPTFNTLSHWENFMTSNHPFSFEDLCRADQRKPLHRIKIRTNDPDTNIFFCMCNNANPVLNGFAYKMGITTDNDIDSGYNYLYSVPRGALNPFNNDNVGATLGTFVPGTKRGYQFRYIMVKDDLPDGTGDTYFGFCSNSGEFEQYGAWWVRDLYSIEDMGGIQITPAEPEPDPSFGPPSGGGGYDNPPFDNSSDPISVPSDPIFNISNLGYLNTYSVGASGLNGMIDEIFPHLDDPTIPEPTGEGTLAELSRSMNAVANGVVNFCINFANQNISQYITDIHLLPVSPSVGSSENIRVGYRELSITAPRVTSDYVTFDCGSLSIAEYYQNFIDYVGTRAQLYLPFYGFVPIEPEYFQGGTLHVVYKFNIIDGSFVAYVLSTSSKSQLTDSVIGTFTGNCCVHVPITSSAFSSICSGLVSGVAHGITTTNAPTFANSGLDTSNVGSALNTFIKPTIPLSNGYNATSSYTGIRFPYLVISRKVASFSTNYPHEKGLPCNVNKRLREISGYTQFTNLHLDGLSCTETEREMIDRILRSGVILPVVN